MNAKVTSVRILCLALGINFILVLYIRSSYAKNEVSNNNDQETWEEWPDAIDDDGIPIDRHKIAKNIKLANMCGFEPTHGLGNDAKNQAHIKELNIPDNWYIPEVSWFHIYVIHPLFIICVSQQLCGLRFYQSI